MSDAELALTAPAWWAMSRDLCKCDRGPRGGIAFVDRTCPEHGVYGRWPL